MQKISKIVINGSISIIKFEVEILEDTKKSCKKSRIGLLKNGLKGIYYLFFGKNWTKSPRTKKNAPGAS